MSVEIGQKVSTSVVYEKMWEGRATWLRTQLVGSPVELTSLQKFSGCPRVG